MRVFVTGGTGLVGRRLIKRLASAAMRSSADAAPDAVRDKFAGCTPDRRRPDGRGPVDGRGRRLRRGRQPGRREHLRPSLERRLQALLIDSRVKTTDNVVAGSGRKPRRDGRRRRWSTPRPSAIYGPHGDEELDERRPPGNDYLARICVAWEKSARAAEAAGMRMALLRIGVVLDREGGALPQLLTPFKLFAGGPAG